tara:strand:- start:149 stop:526 length:378 start_codon:yes stop_codon:yes gene_type:complete
MENVIVVQVDLYLNVDAKMAGVATRWKEMMMRAADAHVDFQHSLIAQTVHLVGMVVLSTETGWSATNVPVTLNTAMMEIMEQGDVQTHQHLDQHRVLQAVVEMCPLLPSSKLLVVFFLLVLWSTL